MPGLVNTGLTGVLTIGAVVMNKASWDLPDLRPLWMSAATRGRDRTLWGFEGESPRPRRRAGTRHLLPMYISGEVNSSDEPVDCDDEAAFMANIQANIDYLLINVVKPVVSATGTRAVSLAMPAGGAARTTDLHVVDLKPGQLRDDGLAMKAILEISVPQPSDLIAA
jgi:hypothetical protein